MATTRTRPLSRAIFRAISAFSGVKVLSLLCSVIRNKLIAVLLGPSGMGIISLYNSAIEMIGALSRLSVDQSAIRDISGSTGADNADRITVVVRRWCLWLGIAGAAVMCLFSPLLSRWMFGDTSRWMNFCALSAVPFVTTVATGYTSLMTGFGQLRRLVRATLFSSLIALIVSAALLLWLGENAIIPMLIGNALAVLAGALVFSPRARRVAMSFREIWHYGAGFIRLGILITIATFVSYLFSYLFVIYLNNTASTTDVGIYQPGYTLLNTYVAVFFAGVWVEYYPRLGRAIHSRRSVCAIVSHEISITLSILLPAAIAFIAADSLIVSLLYDRTFLGVLPFLTTGIAGIVFRTFSWCVAYVIIAKGDGKIFILTESIDAVLGLLLNILGWHIGGFTGLGISYVIWYMLYSVIVYTVYRRRYGLRMPRQTIFLTCGVALVLAAAIILKLTLGWWAPAVMAVLAVPVSLRSLRRRSRA